MSSELKRTASRAGAKSGPTKAHRNGIQPAKVDLVGVIGETAAVALVVLFAGTRLYVPGRVKDGHAITLAIGQDAAQSLCTSYGGTTIRIPLGRELRAKHYRDQGLSNARIAARLGLTEGGVRNLFKRVERRAAHGKSV